MDWNEGGGGWVEGEGEGEGKSTKYASRWIFLWNHASRRVFFYQDITKIKSIIEL